MGIGKNIIVKGAYKGRMVTFMANKLFISPSFKERTPIYLNEDTVASVDVLSSKKAGGAKRGIIGALIGGTAGAIIGASTGADSRSLIKISYRDSSLEPSVVEVDKKTLERLLVAVS